VIEFPSKEGIKLKGKTRVLSIVCLLAFAAASIGCGTMVGAGLGAAIGAIAGDPGLGAAIGALAGAAVDVAWIASELSAQQRMAVYAPPPVVIYGPYYDRCRDQVWGKDQCGRIWVWNPCGNYWSLF